MFYFLLPVLVVSLIILVLGLINPKIIQKLISIKLNRKNIALIFGTTFLVVLFLINISSPASKQPTKNTKPAPIITSKTKNPTIDNLKTSETQTISAPITQTPPKKEYSEPKTLSIPSGATARCKDGTYSFAQNHRGACSHHGGVSVWLD